MVRIEKTAFIIILFALLIGIAGINLINRTRKFNVRNSAIKAVVADELPHYDAKPDDLVIDYRDNGLHLTLTVVTSQPLRYEDVVNLQKYIALQLQQPVSIIVKDTNRVTIDPLIPPTFTVSPTFTSTPTPSISKPTSSLLTATLTYTSTPVIPTVITSP